MDGIAGARSQHVYATAAFSWAARPGRPESPRGTLMPRRGLFICPERGRANWHTWRDREPERPRGLYLLTQHHSLVRDQLARHRGREIDTAGDGFLAAFDGPARAVRCGRAIVDSVRKLGIHVRACVHTGECEVMGEKLGGIAVHIGARIGALAAPDEVLVSRTVSDLVAGSGLRFEARGTHILKGVPGDWPLLAAI